MQCRAPTDAPTDAPTTGSPLVTPQERAGAAKIGPCVVIRDRPRVPGKDRSVINRFQYVRGLGGWPGAHGAAHGAHVGIGELGDSEDLGGLGQGLGQGLGEGGDLEPAHGGRPTVTRAHTPPPASLAP